jgi:fatty acid-binding protein DegV
MLESLKYLIKGGRAPRIALLGDLMGVKPIIGLVNNTGKVDPLCKPRTRRKALQTMVDMLQDYVDTSKPLHVMVHYAESLEDGKTLLNMVTSTYHCAEVSLTEFTPVMSCHTGPMVGLSFYA